jgi:hypothetical protein
MHTPDRTSAPKDLEHGSGEPGRALVVLMTAVMGVTTLAWIIALIVLAGWLISGSF